MTQSTQIMAPLTLEMIDGMTPEELIETFTPTEKKALQQYQKAFDGEVDRHIMWHYEQGAFTAQLYDATLKAKQTNGEGPKKLYGDHLFPRLSKVLCIRSASWFQDVMRIAVRWPDATAFRRDIVQRRGPNGERIQWTQVAVLAAVESDEMRESLFTQTLENGWSLRDLQAELQGLLGPTPRTGIGGPPIKIPKSAGACLSNVRELAQSWVKKCQQAWLCDAFHIREEVHGIPPDELSDELVKQIRLSRELVEQVVTWAAQMGRDLLESEQDVETRLHVQETMAEEQVPEEDAADDSISLAEHRRKQQKAEEAANPKKKVAKKAAKKTTKKGTKKAASKK